MAEQLVKVTRCGQVTIPASLRQVIGIEVGDYVQLRVEGDYIVLTPKKLIDKSQAYFWTKEWQAAEREAEEDIRNGRVAEFDTLEDLFKDLDSPSEGEE
jgi:AbrB family looped-hinge helix DNA binding protein